MEHDNHHWAQWPTWDTIQKSLEQAEKMLNRAGMLIREEFDKLQVAGKYRMDLEPEMIGKVKNEVPRHFEWERG
ncbi:hypothetical protein JKG47_14840 [Acidithiobacillus sp. MC6.1]|nr:hypothetical protein [Acidithiobacillus sp. MC6.1]